MRQAGGQLTAVPTHQKSPASETSGSPAEWHTIQTLKAILTKELCTEVLLIIIQ